VIGEEELREREIETGDILFGPLAELWKTDQMERRCGGQAAYRKHDRSEVYLVARLHPAPAEGHAPQGFRAKEIHGLASGRLHVLACDG
jgi:hypothetical protein